MLNYGWQKNKLTLLAIVLAVLFFMGINACKPEEIPLQFETIERADWPSTGNAYPDKAPAIIIITHPNEATNLNGWINKKGQEKLQTLAYKDYFALAVFQGLKPTLGYDVKINRITKHSNEINIYTHFQEQDPNLLAADSESSPYHVVQVQKTGGKGQTFIFNLIVSHTVVSSVSHFIPITSTLFTSPIPIKSPSSPLAPPPPKPTKKIIPPPKNTEPSFATRQAEFGKLSPELYEKLQDLSNDDMLPVAVWAAGSKETTLSSLELQVFKALAEKYPEVKEAFDNNLKPMEVDDPELAEQIKKEYYAWIDAAIEARVQPIATDLEKRGFEVKIHKGMPSFTATLPKHIIEELNNRDDVSAIYLIEVKEQPNLDSSVPNSLLPNACKDQKTLLSFKSIERATSSGTGVLYQDKKPAIIIVAHPNEVASVDSWINKAGQKKLQTLAYKDYFVLGVFQGFKPTLGYHVKINCITKHNDEINVYTHFQERDPNLEAADEVSSPYHIVQVQKTGGEGQEFTFNLIVSNTIVSSVSHFIPMTTTLFTSPIHIESPVSPLTPPLPSRQAEFGRLSPALYERLQDLSNGDMLPVAVWAAGSKETTLSTLQLRAFEALAEKYPEVKETFDNNLKPMEVDDPELAKQIKKEYYAWIEAAIEARVQPIAIDLEKQGFEVKIHIDNIEKLNTSNITIKI